MPIALLLATALSFPAAQAPILETSSALEVALAPKTGVVSASSARSALHAVAQKPGRKLVVRESPREAYPGLDAATLDDSAPSDDVLKSLAQTKRVVIAAFEWRRDDLTALRDIDEALAAFAASHDAIIYDRGTANALSAAEWRARRVEQGWAEGVVVGMSHIQVQAAPQDDGLFVLATAGMARFGFREFALRDVNRSSIRPVANLMNVIIQRLAEGARPDAHGLLVVRLDDVRESRFRGALLASCHPNAKRAVTVGFARAGQVDALDVTFPGIACAERGVCLDQAIAQLFGSVDEIDEIEHDARVQAAKAKARRALAAYEEKVRTGSLRARCCSSKRPSRMRAAPSGCGWTCNRGQDESCAGDSKTIRATRRCRRVPPWT